MHRPMTRGLKGHAQHAQTSPRRVHIERRSGPVFLGPLEQHQAPSQPDVPPKGTPLHMLTRATTNAVAHRASSMRRMRRRAVAATRLYCSTNGCTSYLVIDETGSTAHCEICGYTRRLH
jgi:hypothetical protein